MTNEGERRANDRQFRFELDRINRVIFETNGHESMLTRVAMIEETLKETRWMKRAMIVMALTYLGDVIARHFHG